jgi:AP-1-like factor
MNQMMFNTIPMQYDMLQYDPSGNGMYPIGKIPVEYTGSSTLDESDRRRRRTGSTTSSKESKEAVPNMHLVRTRASQVPRHKTNISFQRRRAQNRASQRAFRERKEKHVKGLEHQLEDLHEKHQDLLQSYTRQADEVTKLNHRIAELNSELQTLQSCTDQSFSELLTPDKFEKFDAFSGPDLFYNGPECYFNKNAVDFNADLALNSFEDSL